MAGRWWSDIGGYQGSDGATPAADATEGGGDLPAAAGLEHPTAPGIRAPASTASAILWRCSCCLGRLPHSTHGEQQSIREAAVAALGAVHAAGVLHGDVQQDNFVVEPGGCVWVIDFTHATLGSKYGEPLEEEELEGLQAAEQRELSMLLSCRQIQQQ